MPGEASDTPRPLAIVGSPLPTRRDPGPDAPAVYADSLITPIPPWGLSVRGRQLGAAEGAEVRPLRRRLPTGGAEVRLPVSRDRGRCRRGGRAVTGRWHGLTGYSVAGRDHSREERPVVVIGGVVTITTTPAARAPIEALVAAPRRTGTGGGVGQSCTGGNAKPHSTNDLLTTGFRRAVSPLLTPVVLSTIKELCPHGRKVPRWLDLSVAAIAALLFLGHSPVVVVDNLPAGGLEDLTGDPGSGRRPIHLGDQERTQWAGSPMERLWRGRSRGERLPAIGVAGQLAEGPDEANGEKCLLPVRPSASVGVDRADREGGEDTQQNSDGDSSHELRLLSPRIRRGRDCLSALRDTL